MVSPDVVHPEDFQCHHQKVIPKRHSHRKFDIDCHNLLKSSFLRSSKILRIESHSAEPSSVSQDMETVIFRKEMELVQAKCSVHCP